MWRGKTSIFLILIAAVLLFSFFGCQPKEKYKPVKDYEKFEDIRMDHTEQEEIVSKNKNEETDKVNRRNPWEDLESLEKSWLENWGNTQNNLRKGIDFFNVEMYDDAQKEFEKAIEYDPSFAPAYIELGRTFLMKNMPYAAEKALKDASEIDPSLPRAFYYLAATYCQLWKIEDNPKYKELANKNIKLAMRLKIDIPDPEDILDGDCIKPSELDFYTILIKSEPTQVTAFLGDTELGQTPITIKTNLDKIHDVNGKKDGYQMTRKRIRFGEEQTATLTIEMKSVREGSPTEEEPVEVAYSNLEGVVLEHDAIYFDLDKATIREDSYEVLDKIGNEILKFPDRVISIEGHTCDLGTEEYNLELSQRRAQAVADYLTEKFEITPDKFTIKGYGETMPIAPNDTEEGRRKNRRTEIIILE